MTSVFIKTFGCSLNQADSEIMTGILQKAGFEIVSEPSNADCIIINSCAVKAKTQQKFFSYLAEIKKLNKQIIVAGCIPQATPELVDSCSLVGPQNIHNIAAAVQRTLRGERVRYLIPEELDKLSLPSIRKNPLIKIIPIAEGCPGACSYCCVKRARGNLVSNPPDQIVKTAKNALKDGVREIWLAAQDTGCYGKDIKTNLPNLLGQISSIEGEFFARVGMMNPNHLTEFLDELIEAYKSDKVFKFIHIPVQSGNDKVLKRMNRYYSVKDFRSVVGELKKRVPHLTLATDIICGFPGETHLQFQDSLSLIKEVKPDVLNISRFGKRPHTLAASMQELPSEETKRRSALMTFEWKKIALENNNRWIGWKGKVTVDEKGKGNSWVARNFAYKPIILQGNHFLGERVTTKIVSVTANDLRS
ncbi:MAG: tRNA (N(6)-L-threonylcarbamoyladenosine(37)-C(2))-methylthiotransferase [Candidatus Woesearchaeota archaeon]